MVRLFMYGVCPFLALAASAFSVVFGLTSVSRYNKFASVPGARTFVIVTALAAAAGALLAGWLFAYMERSVQ